MPSRRAFVRTTLAGSVAGAWELSGLGLRPVTRAEASLNPAAVRFGDGIEPLVRLLEDTPREKLMEEVTARVRNGLSYQRLLAALQLAGVRNVQPRPSVGFKFHAVLVVNSAHLASLASADEERWLPIFWAIDNFKSSQARDVREGNWTMAAVDEAKVPQAENASSMFSEAMDAWDVSRADVAVAGLSRTASAHQIFELMVRYGARDFRSIGHKAIFVANSYRTLQCIGWQHAEPILRSLTYALLNHEGQPNPADSDLDADRPWRENQERAKRIRKFWQSGRIDDGATKSMVQTLREGTAAEACEAIVDRLNAGVAPQSVYDALFLGAGELLMRQPGIVALHAVTTTNALRYGYQTAASENTRKMLLLQNAAFLVMFREAMKGRGEVGSQSLLELLPAEKASVDTIFANVGDDSPQAAEQVLHYLEAGGDAEELMRTARRLIFSKGNDSHDYKFSSAILEDYYHVSPAWRSRYLASSVFKLRGAGAKDNGLIARIRGELV